MSPSIMYIINTRITKVNRLRAQYTFQHFSKFSNTIASGSTLISRLVLSTTLLRRYTSWRDRLEISAQPSCTARNKSATLPRSARPQLLQAVMEWLHSRTTPKSVFATHTGRSSLSQSKGWQHPHHSICRLPHAF